MYLYCIYLYPIIQLKNSQLGESTMFHSAARKPEEFYREIELTERERASQTKMLMRLFELWKLSPAQQAICLGLSPRSRTSVAKYSSGKAYLPQYRDIQDRIGNLFAIHAALRALFPQNKEIAYTWIHRKNKYFENYTPLEIICRDSFSGIEKIRSYLEQAMSI